MEKKTKLIIGAIFLVGFISFIGFISRSTLSEFVSLSGTTPSPRLSLTNNTEASITVSQSKETQQLLSSILPHDVSLAIDLLPSDSPDYLPISMSESLGSYEYNIYFQPDQISLRLKPSPDLILNLQNLNQVLLKLIVISSRQQQEFDKIEGSLLGEEAKSAHFQIADDISQNPPPELVSSTITLLKP